MHISIVLHWLAGWLACWLLELVDFSQHSQNNPGFIHSSADLVQGGPYLSHNYRHRVHELNCRKT